MEVITNGGKKAAPSKNNLASLPDQEIRDLITRAQGDDAGAVARLFRGFKPLVLDRARYYWKRSRSAADSPDFNEFVAAGRLGLVEAIRAFPLAEYDNALAGLAAYASLRVNDAVHAEVFQWRRRGQAGESRADQF